MSLLQPPPQPDPNITVGGDSLPTDSSNIAVSPDLPPFIEEDKPKDQTSAENNNETSTTTIEQVEEVPQDVATLDEPVIDTIVRCSHNTNDFFNLTFFV